MIVIVGDQIVMMITVVMVIGDHIYDSDHSSDHISDRDCDESGNHIYDSDCDDNSDNSDTC